MKDSSLSVTPFMSLENASLSKSDSGAIGPKIVTFQGGAADS